MRKWALTILALACLVTSAMAGAISPPTSRVINGFLEDPLLIKSLQFEPSSNPCQEKILKWNDDDKTLDICTENPSVTLQVGQEMHVRGVNKTGSTLLNGQVVYISGSQGQRETFALANAASEVTSSKTLGVVTADIANNQNGYVTTFGYVRGIDTSGFSEGDTLWLSTSPGGIQNTIPATPNHATFIGLCSVSHATEGKIFVHPQNGFELYELHDVLITSPATDDSLVYNGTYWRNVPHTFGEFYYHSNGGTLDFSTNTSMINVTGLINGLHNNMTLTNSTGSMTVIDSDIYKCAADMSFQAASAGDFYHQLGVNGIAKDNCHSNRRINTGTDTGDAGITCLLDLATNDVITLMVNSALSETIKYEALNINCERTP